MGPLDKCILMDDALKATETGFDLQFHSHWYRSLPLSCMDVEVTINGKKIDENDMVIEANGNRYPIHQMLQLDKEWLFITEPATLHIKNGHSLEKGKQYEVAIKLDLYIPYIIVGPEQKPLLASSHVTKNLTCN